MSLALRNDKGSALTHDELDTNFAELFNKVSHGLAVGDLVRLDAGADLWVKAQANSEANLADGVVAIVEDADNAWVATLDGTFFTWTTHGKGSTGTRLWTDQSTAGASTSSEPGSGWKQPIMKVVDANTMMLLRGTVENI